MPTIRDAATIRSPLLTLDETKLPDRARLLYERARSYRGFDSATNLLTGSLSNVLFDLWPEYVALKETDAFQAFRIELYTYLRVSTNARCVSRKNPTQWLLAPAWIDTPPPTNGDRPLWLTHTERRLTAEQVGENLPPAPVTTTRVTPPPAPAPETKPEAVTPPPATPAPTPDPTPAPTPTPEVRRDARGAALTGARLARSNERAQYVEMAYEFALKETNGQPYVLDELASALGVHATTARSLSQELVDANRLFGRRETPEERRTRFAGQRPRAAHAMLYSPIDPVPERTEYEIVKGVTPNDNAWEQNPQAPKGHTEKAILDSLTREWQTTLPIREQTNRSPALVDQTLRRLVDRGDVELRRMTPAGETNPNVERNHYRVTPTYAAKAAAATPTSDPSAYPPEVYISDAQFDALKRHFNAATLSQSKLSNAAAIDPSHFSRKLRGVTRFRRAEADRIAPELGLTPEQLLAAPTPHTLGLVRGYTTPITTTKDATVTATATPPVPAPPKPAAPQQASLLPAQFTGDIPTARALEIARIVDQYLPNLVDDSQITQIADLEKRNATLQRHIETLTRERDDAVSKLAAARALFA